MKSRFFLDVVIAQGTTIFELFASEDEALLVWWDTFFVLNFCFDIFNRVRWLNIKGDGLSCKSLNEDLHVEVLFG